MAIKYRKLSKHPSKMSDGDLVRELAGLADSEIVRSLLMAEIDAIRAGDDRETRTMRNLWYSLIKPALSRAGLLNKTTRGGRPVDWARYLSRYLAELVRAGATTYEELRIVDGSRQRTTARTVTKSIADVALVGAHFPWVILFTEKDTIWFEVARLASLYGVSAISGGGEPSNACTENTIRAIARSESFQEAQPESLILLALTDYDPWGYTIAGAQYTQILEAAQGLDASERGKLAQVQTRRVGLEPEQLEPDELAQNVYEPKPSGLADWYAETGGVNGEPLGLELDALPLSRLRGMFAAAIEQVIDLDKRRADLRAAYLDLLACELLRPDFDAKRAALQETIREGDLWPTIAGHNIGADVFSTAAAWGWADIDPVHDTALFDGRDLFACADQVRAAMRARLAELQENGHELT